MYLETLIRSCLLSCSIVYGANTILSKEYEVFHNVKLRGFVEDIINSSLTKIISNIPDPMRIAYKGDDFVNSTYANYSLISGKFNMSNLRIEGLSSTKVSAISCNAWTQSLNLTLEFSDVNMNFDYWVDLVLLDLVPFYGSGINDIFLEKLQLFIYADATLEQNWNLNIKNLTAILDLGDVLFDLNGLLDDAVFSALVNTVLKDNLRSFVNGHREFITRIFSPIVKEVLDQLLHPNATYHNKEDQEYYQKDLVDAQRKVSV